MVLDKKIDDGSRESSLDDKGSIAIGHQPQYTIDFGFLLGKRHGGEKWPKWSGKKMGKIKGDYHDEESRIIEVMV